MAFEPFGYRFEVTTLASPEVVKDAIRKKKVGWYHPAKAARGWIIGPFICLWNDPWDRYGPVLLARISASDLGTRIGGRAGSNTTGVLLFLLILSLMGVAALHGLLSGDGFAGASPVFAGLLLVGTPTILWMADRDKCQADPLVRFIRKALGPNKGIDILQAGSTPIATGARLLVDGVPAKDALTGITILDALRGVPNGAVVIVEFARETYLQTIFQGEGFLIERRDGDESTQCLAKRVNGDDDLSLGEAYQLFEAYAERTAIPSFVKWQAIGDEL